MLQIDASVRGSYTYIDMGGGGSKELKVLPDKLRGGPGSLISRGDLKFYGAPMNNDIMTIPAGDGGPKKSTVKNRNALSIRGHVHLIIAVLGL